MTKKHSRKLFVSVLAYLFLFGTNCQFLQAAASGNYTDLLPIGAAENTTVISRGTGWAITTLAPSQTFGDALSRAPMTVFQSTSVASVGPSSVVDSTFTALGGVNPGFVGSTTFPANWVAVGRSIRITARGRYTTNGTPTWNWGVKLGTTSIISTGALNAPTTVSTQSFTASALLTIAATGSSGSVIASYDIFATTGTGAAALGNVGNVISYSTSSVTNISVDLTSQLTINPTFLWGTSHVSNIIRFNNVLIEFLN